MQKPTDLPINALHQAGGKPEPGRQHFNLGSLESVILCVAAHGKPVFRMNDLSHADVSLLNEGILRGDTKKSCRHPVGSFVRRGHRGGTEAIFRFPQKESLP